MKKILADRIKKANGRKIDYGANNNFCEDRLKNFLLFFELLSKRVVQTQKMIFLSPISLIFEKIVMLDL